MEMYEVNSLLEYAYYCSKDNWEQTRLISYITAQVNSTKNLKITDIMKFPWEDNTEHLTSISNSDLQRLREKAQNYINANQ